MEKLKEVKQSGMDPDEALAQIKEFRKSKNFYMVVGEVKQRADRAMSSGRQENMTDMQKNFHRQLWDDFIEAETDCDAFLNNYSDVREWIVIRSCFEAGFTEELVEAGTPGILDRLRKGTGWEGDFTFRGWERVAWTFYVAKMVEEKHDAIALSLIHISEPTRPY